MSRTFKFTLAATLAFTAFAATAQAQSTNNDQMISALMKGIAEGNASSSDIGKEIESRIREIMAEMGTSPSGNSGDAVTIEEIDRINRAAERERTEMEFEKVRNERSQLEIDRLLSLYEAVKAIEADKREETDALQARIMKLTDKTEEKDKVDQSQVAISLEQEKLPRIDSITGVGGVYSAEAEFSETFKTLRAGEDTMNGFTVEEITPSQVTLRGSSGNLFRLMPTAPEDDMPQSPISPNGVIDLSQFPMAQF
jgi:BMFP domain-containing protein YqiC